MLRFLDNLGHLYVCNIIIDIFFTYNNKCLFIFWTVYYTLKLNGLIMLWLNFEFMKCCRLDLLGTFTPRVDSVKLNTHEVIEVSKCVHTYRWYK